MSRDDAFWPHLTDEEVTSALVDSPDDALPAHVASCTTCREELTRLRRGLQALREETRAASEKPEVSWIRQRVAIAGKRLRQRSVSPRLAWAAGLALVAGLGSLYVTREQPAGRIVALADPDHQLLMDVERAIRRDLPLALEPAALITRDLDRATEAAATAEE